MLERIAFVLLVVTAACGGKSAAPTTGATTHSDNHPPRPLADPANESLDGIQLGDPAAKAEAALGPPDEKTAVEEWLATGDRISTWTWRRKGATFMMAEVEGGLVIHTMAIAIPSTLTTSRGIGIGATFEQVDATYKEFRGQGREESEPEQWDLENGITVGSVYGGTMFTFTDGKVSHIFIGAAAE